MVVWGLHDATGNEKELKKYAPACQESNDFKEA